MIMTSHNGLYYTKKIRKCDLSSSMKISNFFSSSNRPTTFSIIIKPAKDNISVSVESDAGSNKVDIMPETSTDSRPNVPKSVNLDSSCTVDDDFNSLLSESASLDSSFMVDDSLFTVNIPFVTG